MHGPVIIGKKQACIHTSLHDIACLNPVTWMHEHQRIKLIAIQFN
jgi:hypothetical protein